jgi:AcrR family transcriptional regulator
MAEKSIVELSSKDEITKATIVEGAQKLFQHYGLNKTTMEDIAKSLGKSKSSLYYYYATKEEIFEAVVEKEKKIIFSKINEEIKNVNTARDKFFVFAQTKFTEIGKRHILNKIVFEEIYENAFIYKLIKNRYEKREFILIKEILSFGMETGEFAIKAKDLERTAQICAITLRGLHFNMIIDNDGNCNTKQDLLTVAINMLLRAIEK